MPKSFTSRYLCPESGVMPEAWYQWLSRFLPKHIAMYGGREFELRVGPPKRSRTQNAYLWSGVYPAVMAGHLETGVDHFHLVMSGEFVELPITVDFVHEYYKRRFVPAILAASDDPYRDVSTTALDTTEMTQYIEMIREDVMPLGIYVPEPQKKAIAE